MRVCHVSVRCCIRVSKMAAATRAMGHSPSLMAQQIPYMGTCFDAIGFFLDTIQLQREVAESNADIFHVHNEPDIYVKIVKDAAGGRPVLFDCHDLESLVAPSQPPPEAEAEAFQYADGFVHVSHAQKAEAEQRHGNSKPTIVFPSLVNREFIIKDEDIMEPNWKAICYEGGVSTAKNYTEKVINGQPLAMIGCRSLHETVRAFTSQKYMFYLFSANAIPLDDFAYFDAGGTIVQPMIFPAMLRAMRTFAFGFCGSSVPMKIMDGALPNKLFEYLSQGIVPVVFNSHETSRFLAEDNLGITLDSMEDLPSQLERGPEVRENILKNRYSLAMEEHIYKLIEFYEEVLQI